MPQCLLCPARGEDVEMELRRADRGDATDLADLWWRSRLASVPAIPPPVHTAGEVRRFFADVVLPTRQVWVATDTDKIIGLMVLADDWIDQLYLEPGRTGEGVGGMLVRLAQGLRPEGLQLWTFQANIRARWFYERHGFVAVETTDGDNEEGAPDVRYVWPHSHQPS